MRALRLFERGGRGSDPAFDVRDLWGRSAVASDDGREGGAASERAADGASSGKDHASRPGSQNPHAWARQGVGACCGCMALAGWPAHAATGVGAEDVCSQYRQDKERFVWCMASSDDAGQDEGGAGDEQAAQAVPVCRADSDATGSYGPHDGDCKLVAQAAWLPGGQDSGDEVVTEDDVCGMEHVGGAGGRGAAFADARVEGVPTVEAS